ncbi:MAG: hypothetical protein ABI912_06490 [Actinomycetota bacterium]
MPYWTIRTELDDAPGRLAGISGAIAACGGNIVALDVHPISGSIVADELVVEAPSLDAAALAQVIADAGGQRITVTSSDPHDLVDAQTRSLRLLHGLSLATGRRDAALEGALTVLLRADQCALLPASAAGLSYLTERAMADGLPVSSIERPDNGQPPTQVLVVPWRESRGDVRLAVVRRRAPAFTEIEGARARGFLMVAAAITPRQQERSDLLLADGTEAAIRPATVLDAEAIADLHRASPLLSPQVPGVGALGRYAIWVRESLATMNPPERYVVVAETAGEIRAIAGYDRGSRSWEATFGLLARPAQTSRALGAALLRRLTDTASNAGFDALIATVGLRSDIRLEAARASRLEIAERWSRDGRHVRIPLQGKHEPQQRIPGRSVRHVSGAGR